MESLEFLCILAVGLTVAGWYYLNEKKGAEGELGLLAIKPDVVAPPEEKSRGRYRLKERRAVRARDRRSLDTAKSAETAKPAYRQLDDAARARRRFRRQDEARYRVKDKLTGEFTVRDADD